MRWQRTRLFQAGVSPKARAVFCKGLSAEISALKRAKRFCPGSVSLLSCSPLLFVLLCDARVFLQLLPAAPAQLSSEDVKKLQEQADNEIKKLQEQAEKVGTAVELLFFVAVAFCETQSRGAGKGAIVG